MKRQLALDVRYQVRAAVTWRIISELFRRHHHIGNLRLIETHPGGGQYDCLSLFLVEGVENDICAASKHIHLGDFNQQSQRFHLFNRAGTHPVELPELRCPWQEDYVAAYLSEDDPTKIIDDIEDCLGLPSARETTLPPTAPETLIYRVISDVLEGFTLSREARDVRVGWLDSSGYGEGTRRELREFEPFTRDLDNEHSKEDRRSEMDRASAYWLVFEQDSTNQRRLCAVVRRDGMAWNASQPETPINLVDRYSSNGQNIRAIAELVASW